MNRIRRWLINILGTTGPTIGLGFLILMIRSIFVSDNLSYFNTGSFEIYTQSQAIALLKGQIFQVTDSIDQDGLTTHSEKLVWPTPNVQPHFSYSRYAPGP